MVTQKTFSDDYRFTDLFHYGKPMMPNRKVKGACWYRSDSEWGDKRHFKRFLCERMVKHEVI